MKILRYAWVLPFLVVLYVYGNEAMSVFIGSTEHYELLSGLGLPALMTTALVWLSVFIETAVIAAVFAKPSSLTFSIAALWPWVPRVIGAVTGADMESTEMMMSLLASVGAMTAYMAYEELRRFSTRSVEYVEG